MGTIKQEALGFKPTAQVRNIAELNEVSTAIELKTEIGKNKDTGEEYSFKYLEVNVEKYRVPNKVIGDLKEILEEIPNLTKFRVKKSGTGMETRYTLIPLTP